VIPAIDTVSALTAKDAWIWVSTTTIRASQEVVVMAAGALADGAELVTVMCLSVRKNPHLVSSTSPGSVHGLRTPISGVAVAQKMSGLGVDA